MKEEEGNDVPVSAGRVSWPDMLSAMGRMEVRILERFDKLDERLGDHEARLREHKTTSDKLAGQISAWRGLVLFLGLPGLLALAAVVAAAAAGVTVTGPGGLIP
jgi:hypothetical protein